MEHKKTDFNKDIGKRLKEARINAGFITAMSFAVKSSLKISTYGLHEAGTRGMSLDILKKYSELLNIDLIWLLTGKFLKSSLTDMPLHFYNHFLVIRFKIESGEWISFDLNNCFAKYSELRERQTE